jgi:hypothetical protein
MKLSQPVRPGCPQRGLWPAVGAIALSLGCLALGTLLSGAPASVQAGSFGSEDTDGDGLVAHQEFLLGSTDVSTDSDFDGVGDLEELARGSDPSDSQALPAIVPGTVGMAARASSGLVHVTSAAYLQAGFGSALALDFGVRIGTVRVPIPLSSFLAGASLNLHLGAAPGDLIILIDTVYPGGLLASLGSASLYATVRNTQTGEVMSASVLNLVHAGGIPCLLQPIQIAGQSSSNGEAATAAYQPLSPPAEVPVSWQPGSVCAQSASVVGFAGSVTIQQVDAAACESADAFCMPGCANLVGTTVHVLDPLTLLGG